MLFSLHGLLAPICRLQVQGRWEMRYKFRHSRLNKVSVIIGMRVVDVSMHHICSFLVAFVILHA